MQENIAVVSLTNIKNNVAVFRARLTPETKLYAVVKANAYGHGAERVGESVQTVADGLVVTSVREGIALRFGGVEKEILSLTPPLGEDDVFFAAAHHITLTVSSFASLRTVQNAVKRFGICACVHLKVNTGMNRLGLSGAPFARLCTIAAKEKNVRVKGLYSHLYAPDDDAAAEYQRENFIRAKEIAQSRLGRLTCHLSATGGILRGEKYFFDGVRLGIGMYGYLPNGFDKSIVKLTPALKVYTHALQTHRFTGGGVGYASAKKNYNELTAYRLGYADGFPRGGGALKAIGNLCMDGCVTEGKNTYGARKPVFSSADEEAIRVHTIPYEILCAATRRATFEYVGD